MSLLIVGSVAYDSIKTPFGEVDRALGGSALYASMSASFYSPVNMVAVVGSDFSEKESEYLNSRNINTEGLIRKPGETFFWRGEYSFNLNEAHTLETKLNVFEDFRPKLSSKLKKSQYVFLANIDPDIQMDVLDQMVEPKFVALDSMNLWLDIKKEKVLDVISRVDALIINEEEIRQLTDEYNVLTAVKKIFQTGLKYLIIKRGEYGVLFFEKSEPHKIFSLPSYPLEVVKDPTGAGDSFAGGFMGFLAKADQVNEIQLRKAVVIGTVMASINVEDFSLNRFKAIQEEDIYKRLEDFRNILHFEEINV
ncbi:MAG: sugar kinase [bacterium]|nr:sugar kinase [bacterium]